MKTKMNGRAVTEAEIYALLAKGRFLVVTDMAWLDGDCATEEEAQACLEMKSRDNWKYPDSPHPVLLKPEPEEPPTVDDSVKCCPDCERPNQFGELCESCRRDRDITDADGVQTMTSGYWGKGEY